MMMKATLAIVFRHGLPLHELCVRACLPKLVEPDHFYHVIAQVVCVQVTAEAPNETDRFEMIPAPLREALMAFQRDGVRFALQRGTRVLIGDEMGLGKTVQAIALLAAHTEKWPALIVCPSSLRGRTQDVRARVCALRFYHTESQVIDSTLYSIQIVT